MSTIPFTIPKKRRALEVSSDLTDISYSDFVPNSSLQKEIENVVYKCLSESRLRSALNIGNLRKITNKNLEQKFLNYKVKLKANGYSDAEGWGFLHAPTSVQEEEDIFKYGLKTNNIFFNDVAKSDEGVTLASHPDLVTPARFQKDSSVRIIIFKVIRGRQKKVILGSKLPASIDYNSYAPETTPGRVKRSDRFSRFKHSMTFFYEFDDNGLPVVCPANVLPFGVFDFSVAPVYKPNACFEHHISLLNHYDEVCKTSMAGGLFPEKFELSSTSDSVYTVRPDLLYDFKVKRYCTWEHISTHLILKNLFEEQFWSHLLQTKEVSIKDENERYFLAHFLMRSSDSSFVERLGSMKKERKCAIGGLSKDYLVILITQGELASRLGFPYYAEPGLLHAIFLRRGKSIIGSNPLNYELWTSERSKYSMKLDEVLIIDGNSEYYIAQSQRQHLIRVRNGTERTFPTGPPAPVAAPVPLPLPVSAPTPVPAPMPMSISATNESSSMPVRGILSTKKLDPHRIPLIGGRPRSLKRKIRWADDNGLPLQHYSEIERVGNSLSLHRLWKRDLLLDSVRSSDEDPQDVSTSPPNTDYQNVRSTPSSSSSTSHISDSAPDDSYANLMFQDALSSLSSTTVPVELTPFTLPGAPKPTVPPKPSESKLPDIIPERRPQQVAPLILRKKSDSMDMEIVSDSEENRSFSPIETGDLDPNDIDYDSRFKIATVCETEITKDHKASTVKAPAPEPEVIMLSDDEEEPAVAETSKVQDNTDTSTMDELLRNILGKKEKEKEKDNPMNDSVNSFLQRLTHPALREEQKPAVAPSQSIIAPPPVKRRSRFDIPPSQVQAVNHRPFPSPQRGFDVQSPIVQPMLTEIIPLKKENEDIKKPKITFAIKKSTLNNLQRKIEDVNSPFMKNISDIPLPCNDKMSETKANVARNRLMSLLMKKKDPDCPGSTSTGLPASTSVPLTLNSSGPPNVSPNKTPHFIPTPGSIQHQSNIFGARTMPPVQRGDKSSFSSIQNNSSNFSTQNLFSNGASPEPDSPITSNSVGLPSHSDSPGSSKPKSLTREIPLGSEKRKQKKPVRLSDPREEEEGEIVSDEEEQSRSSRLFTKSDDVVRSHNSRTSMSIRAGSYTPSSAETPPPQRFHSANGLNPLVTEWAYIIVPDVLSFEPHCLNPGEFNSFCNRLMAINASKLNDFQRNYIQLHRHCFKHVENKRLTASDEQTRKIFESYYGTLTEFGKKGLIHTMPEHECDEKNGRTQNDITHCLKLALYNYRRKHVKTKLVYMSNQHSSSALGQALSQTAVPIITPQALFSGFPHILNTTYM